MLGSGDPTGWATTPPARVASRPGPLDYAVAARHRPAAAILARLLGVHLTVAVARQRASAGDWTASAADLARRPDKGNPTPLPANHGE
jgi:hypothetical protein